MDQKKDIKAIVICAVLAVVIGLGCFWAGKTYSDNLTGKDREYGIALKKSSLDGLGEITDTIYVTGHKSPDADTVGSSIGFAYLLRQLGYDAKAVVLTNINNETKYILEQAGLDAPELLPDASGMNMVLVDHSEFTQSADGLENARIIGIIDHHAVGSVTTSSALIYDARPLGSAATVVWLNYRDFGITPDKPTATAMAGSIMSDTKNLQADTTTFADREALETLCGIAGISDRDSFYQNMFTASISYEGMTDEDIYFSDYKEYESNGTKYAITCINAYDEEKADDLAKRMSALFPGVVDKAGVDMAFVMIGALHDDVSFTWLIASDEVADAIIAEGYESIAVHEGNVYKLPENVSRKSGVAPVIKDVLESHPQE